MDWGGGRLWIARRDASAEDAGLVRKVVATAGGHATLVRGPDTLRRAIDVFDPYGILNPGRMYRDL